MAAKAVGGFDSRALRQGEVREWLNRSVLKTEVGIFPHRGFESHPHRMRESTEKKLPTEQIDKLTEAVGWGRRGPVRWQEVLSKSSHVYSLWDGDRLVGMGRIVEDGVMCMFYDIAVHPDYQRRGLGAQIINHLTAQVKDKKYVSIGLFTWEGNPTNVAFYQKFGFEKVGTGMELVKYMQREGV